MKFIIYSKDGCPYCDKIKMVLEHVEKTNNINLDVYDLGKNFTREDFYSKFGNNSTFPQVICDDKHLGGCSDTVSYLQKNKLI